MRNYQPTLDILLQELAHLNPKSIGTPDAPAILLFNHVVVTIRKNSDGESYVSVIERLPVGVHNGLRQLSKSTSTVLSCLLGKFRFQVGCQESVEEPR